MIWFLLILKEFVMTSDMDFKIEYMKEMFNLDSDSDLSDVFRKVKIRTGFTNDEIAIVLGYSSGVRISEFLNNKQTPSNRGVSALFFWCLLNIESIEDLEKNNVEFILHDFKTIPQS